jgi:hypothetical protein
MATDEEEHLMINELMNLLRISEEWIDAKTPAIEARSSLAGDDAKTKPYQLSSNVAQSITIAIDHLHCFRMARQRPATPYVCAVHSH